jgi:hypothetical protein
MNKILKNKLLCNWYYITFVLGFILLSESCSKLEGEYYLTAAEKAQIPFQGYETITYTDDKSNSIKLKAGDRIDELIESPLCINCRDYAIVEYEHIKFMNDSITLSLSMSTTRYIGHPNDFGHGLSIDSIYFSNGFASPLSIEKLRPEETHFDSLLVNNKMYYNIFSDTLTHLGIIELEPYPIRMYYSMEFGVIKFDFSDGTVWELEKIEWNE